MPRANVPLDEMRAGLALLLQAFDLARDAGCDISEFAVEIHRLESLGLTIDHLRWIIAKGFARHLVEVTEDGNDKRVFHPAKNRFHKHSCLLLLDNGAEFARGVCRKGRRPASAPQQSRDNRDGQRRTATSVRPRWNSETRELKFRSEILIAYSRAAPIQHAALDKFEATGWKRVIDVRSFLKGPNIKNSLHNTIRALNSRQRVQRLAFAADGTGFGIRWSVKAGGPSRTNPAARGTTGIPRRNGRGKS